MNIEVDITDSELDFLLHCLKRCEAAFELSFKKLKPESELKIKEKAGMLGGKIFQYLEEEHDIPPTIVFYTLILACIQFLERYRTPESWEDPDREGSEGAAQAPARGEKEG